MRMWHRRSARRHAESLPRPRGAWCVGAMALALSAAALADTFAGVRFDPRTDELVVTMLYRGTNPNHGFSLHWDPCPAPSPGQRSYDVVAEVLDNQWNDAAQQTFTQTVRFPWRGSNAVPRA